MTSSRQKMNKIKAYTLEQSTLQRDGQTFKLIISIKSECYITKMWMLWYLRRADDYLSSSPGRGRKDLTPPRGKADPVGSWVVWTGPAPPPRGSAQHKETAATGREPVLPEFPILPEKWIAWVFMWMLLTFFFLMLTHLCQVKVKFFCTA